MPPAKRMPLALQALACQDATFIRTSPIKPQALKKKEMVKK